MKNKIKKIIATLLVSLTVSTTAITMTVPPLVTEAHGGRTDSNGGHKDNKNKSGLGSYHYHCGGHPAHLHENGVCPYAGTNTTSDASSSSNTKSDSNSTQTSSVKANNNAADKPAVIISDTSYDNAAFNASYYANKHEDVYKLYGDNAKALYDHFITYGIYEGRQSSEQFSILVYKENNKDLSDVFGDDLIKYYNHFIEYGVNENRVSK